MLEKRIQQRFDEVRRGWDKTKAKLTADPTRLKNLPPKKVWASFLSLARNLSFDSLVQYFGSYIANDDDKPPLPPISVEARRASPKQERRRKQSGRPTPSRTTTHSSKIAKARPERAGSRGKLRRSERLQARAGQ